MHLIVPDISIDEINVLIERIHASKFCPFKECEVVEVIPKDDVLIFKYDSKFSFYHYLNTNEKDIVQTMNAYLSDKYAHICSYTSYEINSLSQDIELKIRNEFAKKYGVYFANKIDIIKFSHEHQYYAIVKLPFSVVRELMKPTNGTLMTVFKGTAGNLQKIPSLQSEIESDINDSEKVHKIFTTKYNDGNYTDVQSIHYNIVNEVICRPNLGICIGPIASWFLYTDEDA